MAAQSTGLKRAASWIQPGIKAAAMNAEDRKVSGRSSSCTAPITDSSLRTSKADRERAEPGAEQYRGDDEQRHAGDAGWEVSPEREGEADHDERLNDGPR